jgi:hypothetical protein
MDLSPSHTAISIGIPIPQLDRSPEQVARPPEAKVDETPLGATKIHDQRPELAVDSGVQSYKIVEIVIL